MAAPSDTRTAHDLAATWRPQLYGRRPVHEVPDPLLEPNWLGARVLASIAGGVAEVRHDGEIVEDQPAIVDALARLVVADGVVIDGVLTSQAFRTGEGASIVETPAPRRGMLGRLFIPESRRRQDVEEDRAATERAIEARDRALDSAEDVAFVAIDLLWLDGESLLDVPLLERKRLLESVVAESELVRLSAFVRPGATGSVLGWRALGFDAIVYRAANGRYRPGEVNELCTVARIPSGQQGGGAGPPGPRRPSGGAAPGRLGSEPACPARRDCNATGRRLG